MRRVNESDYYQAIDFFQKAVQEDQSLAPAYAGQAQSFLALADLAVRPDSELLMKAEAAVKEALKLDNSLAEAHSAYGSMLYQFRWDWEKAEQEFKRGLQLNPGSANARLQYIWYLRAMGRYEEAYIQAEKAHESDPLSIYVAIELGANVAGLGRYNDTLEYLLNTLEMNPKSSIVLWHLATIYIETEEFEKGIQTLHQQIKLMEGENISDEIGMLAYSYGRWGKTEEAEEYLRQLISYSEQNYVSPTIFAVVYGALGNLNEAFKWLDLAYDQKDSRLTFALRFWYDPIRNDPRFKEMLKKIGLDK